MIAESRLIEAVAHAAHRSEPEDITATCDESTTLAVIMNNVCRKPIIRIENCGGPKWCVFTVAVTATTDPDCNGKPSATNLHLVHHLSNIPPTLGDALLTRSPLSSTRTLHTAYTPLTRLFAQATASLAAEWIDDTRVNRKP